MAVINTYTVGALVRCSCTFADSGGTPTDPTTSVVFKFKDPSGNTTTYTHGVDAELVKDDTGDYHVDVDVDEAGNWHYRFAGAGTGQAADEHYFVAEQSQF